MGKKAPKRGRTPFNKISLKTEIFEGR